MNAALCGISSGSALFALRQNQSSEKTFLYLIFEIITCDPSIYTMEDPVYQTLWEILLVHKGLNKVAMGVM